MSSRDTPINLFLQERKRAEEERVRESALLEELKREREMEQQKAARTRQETARGSSSLIQTMAPAAMGEVRGEGT